MNRVDEKSISPKQSFAAANACVLVPELTLGAYFLVGDLIRQDITDVRPGTPLRLKIRINNAITISVDPDAISTETGMGDVLGWVTAHRVERNITSLVTFLRGLRLQID